MTPRRPSRRLRRAVSKPGVRAGGDLAGGGEQIARGEGDDLALGDRLLQHLGGRDFENHFQIGAREAGGRGGEGGGVDPAHGALLGEGGDDPGARPGVGRGDEDGVAEAPRAAEGGIDLPGDAGGGDDEDALVPAARALHLEEELRGEVPVRVAQVVAVPAVDVELVEEDDGGGGGAGEVEEAVDGALAPAGVAVEDLEGRGAEEGGVGLPGGRVGEEGLPAPGRAVEEDAPARLLAVGLVELRVRPRAP